MSQPDFDANDTDNILNILIATDTHLGYAENHSLTGNDSFNSFEEVLQIAVRENVDFILLGGDLFHETKPSPACLDRCIKLMKKYCLGDKPVEMEFICDSNSSLRSAYPNFDDPNLNIAIPIFSIHGNHDDPTGKEQTSALDILASMGLVNYFGRINNISQIDVSPIILRKGETLLSLYGLSHVRDSRLARLFEKNLVHICAPENHEDYFNLFVLHQNRHPNRGEKNYIPEQYISEIFDLAIWGHEHDCFINPVYSINGRTMICQPGSSVATSLSEGEAIPKHVGLLRVQRQTFGMNPIALTSIRPFVFKQVNLPALSEYEIENVEETAMKQVIEVVDSLIREANAMGRNMLPLIRVIVHYTNEKQVFNAIRFGANYVEKVANPTDIIKFAKIQEAGKRGTKTTRRNRTIDGGDGEDDDEDYEQIEQIEEIFEESLSNCDLGFLPLKGLIESVSKCIQSNNTDAPIAFMDNQSDAIFKKLKQQMPTEDQLLDCFARLKEESQAQENCEDFFNRAPARPVPSRMGKFSSNETITINDDSDDDALPAPSTSKGRGKRGTTTTRARGRGSRSRVAKALAN